MKPISILEHSKSVNVICRVAVERDGKYLLVQENKPEVRGLWSFVGGKLDVGETLSAAAVREVFEETGVKVELTGLLGLRSGLWEDQPGVSIEIFFTAKCSEVPNKQSEESSEIKAFSWKTLAQIEQLEKDGQLRNPSQSAVLRFIKSGRVLPLDHLFENITSTKKAI